MASVQASLAERNILASRVKQLGDLFAGDPEVARIEHRFGEDRDGDSSLFFKVFLTQKNPSNETVGRLSRQVLDAFLDVVRSEEFDIHSYVNFVSAQDDGN
jgi:hypothetical protein